MEWQPIRPQRLYERILEQIITMIQSGELAPGQKMPTAKEFAERLGVGQSSIREAMSALQAVGLVEVRHGEGAFVRDTQGDILFRPLQWILLMERDSFEALEVRKFLEVGSAGLAARRRTPEDLRRLEGVLSQMEQDLQTGRLGEEADWQFHLTVAQASGNSILIRLMHTLSDTLQKTMRYSRERLFRMPGMAEHLLQEHRDIYQAIVRQDPEAAEQRMYEHLTGVEDCLRGYEEESPS